MANQSEPVVNEAAVEGLAGAGGAIVALLTTYPLLTINTRQQTQKKALAKNNLNNSSDGTKAGGEEKRKTTLEEAREILRSRGVAGLYAGLKPAFVGTICSNLVYFYLCGYLRETWVARREAAALKRSGQRRTKELNALESLAIASVAGCGNVLATNPIWILVTRMQANRKKQGGTNNTLSQTAVKLYGESGVLGFWKGVGASLIMVSNPSIQYMFFEALGNMRRERSSKTGKLKPMTAFDVFCNSAVAKLLATVITYPMLVVKSNMQNAQAAKRDTVGASSGAGAEADGYSITGTVASILESEGPAGFYKGMKTKIFQSVFAASLLYMCKEEIKKGARVLVKATSGK